MKWKLPKSRYTQLGMLFFFLFIILGIRLAELQVVRGIQYKRLSENLVTRVIPLKARRGAIYDKNGEVLAWNRPSFNVEIFQNELGKGDANKTILKLVDILDKNDEAYFNRLPLVLEPDSNGNYRLVFNWGENGEREKNKWMKLYNLSLDLSAAQVYERLSKRYKLESEYNLHQGLKILAVWNEIKSSGFQSYKPVIIARDIKTTTTAVLEEIRSDLPGVEITPDSIRYYPNNNSASHVLGYMGLITAEEWEANKAYYQERDYNPSVDLVGRWEMEKVLEPYLRGIDGGQKVQIDAAGHTVKVLESKEPLPGHDVYLTIDLNIQRAAEDALSKTMAAIRTGEIGTGFPNAYTGSAVVIDVNTGSILALANKPDYNPNFSATGRIDPDVWKEYNPFYPDPRNPARENLDPTLPRPLRNNAVRGIFPPGSTYKMLVAAAGLEEGVVNPHSIIVDQGRYTRYTNVNPPACWIWNQHRGTHGPVDVISGLRDSCNYYFYEVGNRLGIDAIEEYARKFGFGRPTGIELPGEVGGIIAGKTNTNTTIQFVLKYRIARLAGKKWNDVTSYEKEFYTKAAGEFIENNNIGFILKRLSELGIETDRAVVERDIYNYIRDYRWNPGKTLSASIGQAENTFSPLQMANYTAALANGGTLYKTHLVDRIISPQNETVIENNTQVLQTINMNPDNLQAVLFGMRAVTSNVYHNIPGTAARYFTDFPIPVAGKTGSAQFPGRDAYGWFVGFAPYEKPEIAVAVMIAQAGSGGYTAPVALSIFEQYFSLKQQDDNIRTGKELQR